MMTKRCACCDQPFEPRPQVPDQAFCSSPDCQRARKQQWQRDKLKSDGEYIQSISRMRSWRGPKAIKATGAYAAGPASAMTHSVNTLCPQ